MRNPWAEVKSSAPKLEKAPAKQRRPSTAKNFLIKKINSDKQYVPCFIKILTLIKYNHNL